jgi:hypothetical protein
MSATFKSLRGRRILVEKPVRPESTIELTEDVKQRMEIEMMRQWTKLEVFAIGEDVESIAVGDKVYLPSGALQTAEVVNIEGELKLMVSEFDVAIVW